MISLYAAETGFRVETVADGLRHPWAVAFLPDDGGILVTERAGRLLLIRPGATEVVSGTPEVKAVGQGGLLDIVLSPDFARDSLIYLSYTEGNGQNYGTAVARGRLSTSGNPKIDKLETIYQAGMSTSTKLHFGSRLLFDKAGYLYVTLGERGERQRAQDPRDPYGSVLRLNADGSIPPDNPFASRGERPGEGAPEIWTWGHRNAQGMALNPRTGDIWIHEHGPKGGDEINILKKGANYGWPRVSFGVNYNGTPVSDRTSAPGNEDPLLHWTPSIAPSGMTFYVGTAFPQWSGSLFVGALAGRHLRRVVFTSGGQIRQEILLRKTLGRVRDVRVGPDDDIYLVTDAARGALYRLVPGK